MVAIGLSGCTTPNGGSKATVSRAEFDQLRIIHVNDDGSLPKQDKLTISELCREIVSKPQTVVVFMHGWKGSAASSDHSVQEFLTDLSAARSRSYQRSHRTLTGVYLTWNSRRLPGLLEYLAYFKTRDRADDISQGDGIANAIHDLAIAARSHGDEHFIVAGHSFGARIVGRVIGKHPELLRSTDLVLLANAADDADSGRRIINAVNARPYRRGRLPKLVWVTSAKDDVTRTLYFLAGWKTAIGHDKKLQTHILTLAEPPNPDPCVDARIQRTSNRLGRYAHNIIVAQGLQNHPDVWGKPMVAILNEYLGYSHCFPSSPRSQ